MQTRIALCVMSLALASPAWAQTPVQPTPVTADPNQEAIKHQVAYFESTLRTALEIGKEELAKETHKIVPSLDLRWNSDLAVSGWWIPTDGYTFHVMIPDISPMFSMLVMKIQQQAPAGTPPGTQVSNSTTRPSAAATVTMPDPVIASPVVPFEPDKVFSDRVRQALIDALADNAVTLPIKPGQSVRIVAHPGADLMPNPFGGESRKLILSVSGDDLLAFRKGDLKRDAFIAKIKEERF